MLQEADWLFWGDQAAELGPLTAVGGSLGWNRFQEADRHFLDVQIAELLQQILAGE